MGDGWCCRPQVRAKGDGVGGDGWCCGPQMRAGGDRVTAGCGTGVGQRPGLGELPNCTWTEEMPPRDPGASPAL